MKLLKRLYNELVRQVNVIQTTDISNLVKTANYNTNISDIEKEIFDCNHDKDINTQEFNN